MYNSAEIAERIKAVAKSKGIPVKKMLEDIGLGNNTMANMRTSMPKADNLAKIADYLGCSVDYLMGRENNESPAPNDGGRTAELLLLFSSIPQERRKEAISYLRFIVDKKEDE